MEFREAEMKVIIKYQEGPIVIKADSQIDFEKWKQSILQTVQNAQSGARNLVMKLNQVEKKLYVYKGETQQPSRVFNVENCIVEIKVQGEYGNVN